MSKTSSKVFGFLLVPLYLPIFLGILVVFDPILKISKLVSKSLFQRNLELMNYLIILNLRITALASFKINISSKLPEQAPVIFISNHQSMYDVPFIIWNLKKYRPKFISKKELGKFIPSISFSLREMGSLLIDRNDKTTALNAISTWAKEIAYEKKNISIFPEGTRARDGIVKNFKTAGFSIIHENMPEAVIVPIAISRSWELLRYNLLPVPCGIKVTFDVLDPIENKANKNGKEILKEVEELIRGKLNQRQST